MLEKLLDHLLFSYVFAVTLFLMCRIFNKAVRNRTEGFLNAANTGLLLLLSLNMIVTVLNVVQCKELFQDASGRTSGAGSFFWERRDCIAILLLNFVLAFVFHLLFLWRKYRIRIWLTVVLGLMLLYLLNYEYALVYRVEKWGTKYSWDFYYSGPTEWVVAVFTIIYFMVCWIASRSNVQDLLKVIFNNKRNQ